MIVPRRDVLPEDWDACVEAHPEGWIWHLSAWCDYLMAGGREDCSEGRIIKGALVGLCPALLPVPADDPLPAPLGDGWPPLPWPTRRQPTPTRLDGSQGFYTRVVDLSLSPADLWRGLRRSYHALIHRAEERYTVGLFTVADLAELYAKQPDLPQLTGGQWDCVQRIYNAGHLIILGAITTFGSGVGAIGIYHWKGHAYYGHGRSLVPNVNHLLHWQAMRLLPGYGVSHYETGWEARPEDDAKAQNISHHKMGFGGERWWVRVT